MSAKAGHLQTVEYLLKYGASVHARWENWLKTVQNAKQFFPFHHRDNNDDNALHYAIQSKNIDVIRVIRKAGGQVVASKRRIGSILDMKLCLVVAENFYC